MLVDANLLPEALSIIQPDDIQDVRYRIVVQAAVELIREGTTVDLYTVAAKIVDQGKFHLFRNADGTGGNTWFSELHAESFTGGFLLKHAERIKVANIRRAVATACIDGLRDVQDSAGDPRDIAAEAIRKMSDSLMATIKSKARHISEYVGESLKEIEARKGKPVGEPTGFDDIDEIVRLRPGHLFILGARPSVGKTALGLNIAYEVAKNSGKAVYFASLEMSGQEITERLIASVGEVNSELLALGHTDEVQPQIAYAVNELIGTQLFLDDEPGQTMLSITSKARTVAAKQDLGLIVVDYLQLIEPEDKKGNRNEQVSRASRQLKALARQLEVPVLCLCQLNRGIEGREGGKPRLSDLRDSGAIEQDADVVTMMWRPDDDKRQEIRVSVAKHRGGRIGVAQLQFTPEYLKFENVLQEWSYGAPPEGGF